MVEIEHTERDDQFHACDSFFQPGELELPTALERAADQWVEDTSEDLAICLKESS